MQHGCYRGQDTESKVRHKGEVPDGRDGARWAKNRFRKKGGQPKVPVYLHGEAGQAAGTEWPD